MDHALDRPSSLRVIALCIGAVIVLYVAQEVLLPFVLALLLSFLLTPLAAWFERIHIGRFGLGRIGSVVLVVLLAFIVLAGVGWLIVNQAVKLANDLPKYEDTLIARIDAVRERLGGPSPLAETVSDIRSAATGESPAAAEDEIEQAREPVLVQIVENSPVAIRILSDWLGPLMAPLGTAAIVIVFTIFMLIQREDLRDRFISLVGAGRVYLTTQAMDEAAARVSRYLAMLLVINGSYGVAVAAGLLLIGIPNALLWGLLAGLFRFVPYVGPWIAALLPIALSFAVSTGWFMPVATVGLFLVLELVSNNVLEPWLYGAKTGVSVVGIIFAATFWTWLWGPIGLVLAMPLTVCLTVLGRFVPQLGFLNVLLSDEPALELHVRYYQRLLTFDEHEASDLISTFLKNGTLEQLYEKMLIPALSYSERDRHASRLTEHQLQFIHRTLYDVIYDLGREFDMSAAARAVPAGAAAGAEAATTNEPVRQALRIACVPAEDEADRIAGEMLVQLLSARGHAAKAYEFHVLDSELVAALQQQQPAALIVSALAPGGAGRARQGCERVGKAMPDLQMVVGLWNSTASMPQLRERLSTVGIDFVTPSISEALSYVDDRSQDKRPEGAADPAEMASADRLIRRD